MASDDALDDAIAHLDRIISHLTNGHAAPSLLTPMQKIASEKDSVESAFNQGQETGLEKGSLQSASNPGAAQGGFQNNEQHKEAVKPPTIVTRSLNSATPEELLDDFKKAHLQVGHVLSVENHPVADKLYICKVEVAKGQVRQVVAGLRRHLSSAELLGKKVCLLLNLKPAKLAGQLSEAMILAGEASDTSKSLNVKILQPQEDASAGDKIYLEDSASLTPPAKQLSSKIWEKLVAHLTVDGGVVKFNKKSLVTTSGFVMAPGLPNGAAIH